MSTKKKMLEKIYREEDLFPKGITSFESRNYGILFYNEEDKDSFDANHALIYKKRISDLGEVLQDITSFYKEKGIKPTIYQSMSEEGYFEENKELFSAYGFGIFSETQKYMVLAEKNRLSPNTEIQVLRVNTWRDAYKEIFIKADEPWEIEVAKRALDNENTLFFVAFYQDKPIGMLYAHVIDGVCRGDYLLVEKEYRNIGVGRTLMYYFTEFCSKEKRIEVCYLWPAGDSAEKIYLEAGFREVETRNAGRAVCKIASI